LQHLRPVRRVLRPARRNGRWMSMGLRAVLALRSARIHRLNIRLFIPDIAGISAGDNPARAARTAVEMHS
jgi:hypothetical protein